LYQKDVGARGLKTFCENTECNDGLLNQDETDVDCGGSICQACPLGSTCTIDGDCISDLCAAGVCSSATTTTTLTPLIRRVFVTSSTTDGALGGLAGADAFCQGLADSAVLGGTWTAWLSTSSPSVDAKDRIPDAQYQLVDGTVIANSKADLTDGSLLAPISRDETGAVPAGQVIVWTGTLADGTEASSTSNCMGWTSNAFPNNDGLRGDMTSVTGQWTDLGVVETCTVVHRIYCFEQ
jgi:hypothetical protein